MPMSNHDAVLGSLQSREGALCATQMTVNQQLIPELQVHVGPVSCSSRPPPEHWISIQEQSEPPGPASPQVLHQPA